MATNLLDLFDYTIGNELVRQMSGIIGETAERTGKAVQIGAPAILSALSRKVATTTEAAALVSFMHENNLDGSLLSNPSDWLQGDIQTEKLMYSGALVSRFLFDDHLSGVVDVISTQSGVSTSSATSIIKIAAPFMMNILARYNQEKGLDAAGVQTLLSSQESLLKGLLPTEMNLAMGLPPSVQTSADPSQESTGEHGRSKLLPWIVLILTALGIFYFVQKGCAGNEEETESIGDDLTSPRVADTIATKPAKAADSHVTYNLPGGKTLRAHPSSYTANLISFIEGSASGEQCFTFEKVHFEEHSVKLAKSTEKQLGEFADLLKAYPDIKVHIEDHTGDQENDGKKSKHLTKEHAKEIKKWLEEHGVPAGKIQIKSSGKEKRAAAKDSASESENHQGIKLCFRKK